MQFDCLLRAQLYVLLRRVWEVCACPLDESVGRRTPAWWGCAQSHRAGTAGTCTHSVTRCVWEGAFDHVGGLRVIVADIRRGEVSEEDSSCVYGHCVGVTDTDTRGSDADLAFLMRYTIRMLEAVTVHRSLLLLYTRKVHYDSEAGLWEFRNMLARAGYAGRHGGQGDQAGLHRR